MVEGTTTAPNLLTEADLISLMDKHGIGTDATHAEHINTIKERGYIGEIQGGYLVPGSLGMGLVEGYESIKLPLAHPELRAELERDLKLICSGQKNPDLVLEEQVKKYKEVYKVITEKIQAIDATIGIRFNVTPQPAPVPAANASATNSIEEVFKCPKCDRYKMVLRNKRDNTGFYLNCQGKPNCDNVIFLSDLVKDIKVDASICPSCRANNKKVQIKFKQRNILALLNGSRIEDDNSYLSCFVCDSGLRSVLDIDESSVKKTVNRNPPNSSTSMNNNRSTNQSRPRNTTTTTTTTTSSGASLWGSNNTRTSSSINSSNANIPSNPARPSNTSSTGVGRQNNWNNNNSNWSNNTTVPARNNNTNNFNNHDDNVLCPSCNAPAVK